MTTFEDPENQYEYWLNQARRKDANHPRLNYIMGCDAADAGDYDAAIKCYQYPEIYIPAPVL